MNSAKHGGSMRKIIEVICCGFFLMTIATSCVANLPEETGPTGTLTISSLNPVESSSVDVNSNLFVSYAWDIQKYDASKKYAMQVWLYDTNTGSAFEAVTFEINSASGSNTANYGGRSFYNCFLGCVRKTALPFRVFFVLVYYPDSASNSSTTLVRTRQYIYN
jgi:hypothetical protein